MSEETEVPEVPEQKEHHPVKQSSGGSGAFLAILIALSAAGGVYYLWQQQQGMRQENRALEQSLNAVEERHNTLVQRIDTLAQHHHPDTEEQVGKVERLVQDLHDRLGQGQREWMIAEVEYLLRIAGNRLTLEHDKDTTVAALKQARERLATLEQDNYLPVIRQIDSDISKLTAISLPDREQIATELAALIGAAEHWPSTVSRKDDTESEPVGETTAETPERDSGWRAMLAGIWDDIRGLVTIRRNGEIPSPMLEPKQHAFLQQNLQLKLEAARLALLAGNTRAYHGSLNEAAEWLQRYFDTSAPAVSEAQGRVRQLAAIDLEPALPALGNNLELLQQAARQTSSRQQSEPVQVERPAESAPQANETPTAPIQQDAKPADDTGEPAMDVPAQPQGNGQ